MTLIGSLLFIRNKFRFKEFLHCLGVKSNALVGNLNVGYEILAYPLVYRLNSHTQYLSHFLFVH